MTSREPWRRPPSTDQHPTVGRRAPLRGRPPWLTLALLAVLVAMAALTLGARPPLDATDFAAEPGGDPVAWGSAWWLAHGGIGHLLANLLVLAAFGPALERHVGGVRVAVALAAGNGVGLVAHLLVHPDRPLLGASAGIYALVAYSLVVGWHCPFEARHGGRRLWPATVFHGVVVMEVARWGMEVAASRPPGSAVAHLGGVAGGVLVCGLLHDRWPAAPGTRRALGSGAPAPGGRPAAGREVAAWVSRTADRPAGAP